MGRVFRFLFGTGIRAIVTLSVVGVLLVLGHFHPDLIYSLFYWVGDRIFTAFSRLFGAAVGGAGDAVRQHSGFFKSLAETTVIGLAIYFMVRACLRSLFGKSKKKS
jgi:hypothetical protein